MLNLKRTYNKFNRDYWGGKLPEADVEWAVLRGDRVAEVDLSEAKPRVSISLELYYLRDNSAIKMNILHEQAHIYLDRVSSRRCASYKAGDKDHGPEFNRVMLGLAKKGAMNGLW